MSVNNTTTEQTYNCNGSTTVFPIPFAFLAGEEIVIKVYKILLSTGVATLLTKDVDYTLDNPATAVTMLVAPSSLYTIKLKRVTAIEQSNSFTPGPFPAESVGETFDRITMLIQEVNAKIAKVFTVSEGNPLANFLMPMASANKLIGWNSGGTALENKDPIAIAQLQTDVTNLLASVVTLQATVAAHTSTIANDGTNISQLDDDLSALSGFVHGTVQATLNSLGATLANVQPQIDDLQGQIDAITDVSATVAAHTDQINATEAGLENTQDQVADLETRVSSLEATTPLSEFAGSLVILNNQVAPVEIVDATGAPGRDFKRNANGTQLARVMCQIDRRTDSEIRYTHVSLLMRFIEETQLWYITRENTTAFVGEPDGVDFSISTDPATLVGQVSYVSDNMAGANYSGKIKFLGKEIPTGV